MFKVLTGECIQTNQINEIILSRPNLKLYLYLDFSEVSCCFSDILPILKAPVCFESLDPDIGWFGSCVLHVSLIILSLSSLPLLVNRIFICWYVNLFLFWRGCNCEYFNNAFLDEENELSVDLPPELPAHKKSKKRKAKDSSREKRSKRSKSSARQEAQSYAEAVNEEGTDIDDEVFHFQQLLK